MKFLALLLSGVFAMAIGTDNTPTTISPELIENLVADDTSSTFPTIMIKEKDKSNPLGISDLKITSEIQGNLAYVTYDMTFHNDLDRVLEGQLYFPLSEGQSVSHLELEVNGKLREGVVVEKEKGRVAFESTVRRQIDPGLVEWTKGNNFKMRIYPIPSKGSKRVIIGFHQELQLSKNGAVFQLPMNFPEKIKNFEFSAEVINQTDKPVVPRNNMSLKFSNWQNNFKTETKQENYRPNEDIAFYIPFVKENEFLIKTKGPNNDEHIYYGFTSTTLQTNNSGTLKNIALVWDASHSGNKRNHEQELELLDRFFYKYPKCNVELKIVRNDFSEIIHGSWNNIIRPLVDKIEYDGATQLGEIKLKEQYDAVIFVSDGLQSFGNEVPKFGNNLLYTINSSKEANHGFLRSIANTNGGSYINLNKTSPNDALAQFGSNNPILGVDTPKDAKYKTIRNYIVDGKMYFSFCFSSSEDLSKINYRIISPNDKTKQGELTAAITTADYLSKICGQRITDEWAHLSSKEQALTQLGKAYNIVTPGTSLIVLDRVEDYVEHEIKPPTELVKEWETQMAAKSKDEKKEYQDHLALVIKDFTDKAKWYDTYFDWKKVIVKKKELEKITLQETNNEMNNDGVNTISTENGLISTGSVEREESVDDLMVTYAEAPTPLSVSSEAEIVITDGFALNLANSKKDEVNKDSKDKISIESWNPDTPYMKNIKAAKHSEAYNTYLKEKKEFQDQPSFFLDVVDYLIEIKEKELALRVLSNIAEMELDNHQLLRILAHRLEQLGYYELAFIVYKEVEKIRAEEPQTFRDLGLISEKMGLHQQAVDYLYKVVSSDWDNRFPQIEVICASEMNQILIAHEEISTANMDQNLIKPMPMDMRVVVEWDADNCDIDLWVTDPLQEKCFYSHKKTEIGGLMSQDFTGGYGPEEYNIKTGAPGEYNIQVNYYGSNQQTIAGPTTIIVKVYTNYGKPNQKVQEITRRVESTKEVLNIGKITLD